MFKTRKIMRFSVAFFLMILSSGVLGAYLLSFQLSLQYFAILVPLFLASYVSFHNFWNLLSIMEEANCPKSKKLKFP